MERRSQGSAIAMVVIFLAIIGLVAIATSSQSSFVRRSTARSFYGFEAVEVCESAINEAHAQITDSTHIFPQQVTSDWKGFALAVSQNNMATLRGQYASGGYVFKGRPVTGGASGLELFTVMMWPEATRPTKANNYKGKLRDYKVPLTQLNAKTIPGFKKLSDVELSVLAWRRDHPEAQSAWQDWGVMHYRVTAEFDDGKNTVVRTMHVDRMFTIYAHFRGGNCPPGLPCPPVPLPCSALPPGAPKIDPHNPPDPPDVKAAEENACPDEIFVHFIKSRANLKTVILRS